MKLCNPEELKSMIEKEMAGKFGASLPADIKKSNDK
jgi:hypothetical protein